MIVSFNIEYRTSWGEEVRVTGSIPELGEDNPEYSIPLRTVDGIHWTAETEIQVPNEKFVNYSYLIWQDGKDTASMTVGRIFRNSSTSIVQLLPNHCWHITVEQAYLKVTKKA